MMRPAIVHDDPAARWFALGLSWLAAGTVGGAFVFILLITIGHP